MQLLKILFTGVLLVSLLSAVGGCAWMGKTAGKAQAKVERGVKSMEEGYQEGYEAERAKSPAKN